MKQGNPHGFIPYVPTLPSASLRLLLRTTLVFSTKTQTWNDLAFSNKLLSSLRNSRQLYHNKKIFFKKLRADIDSFGMSFLPPSLSIMWIKCPSSGIPELPAKNTEWIVCESKSAASFPHEVVLCPETQLNAFAFSDSNPCLVLSCPSAI